MSVFKKGESYLIDYYFQGKRIRESAGPNKQLAVELLHKRKAEIAERKFFPDRIKQKILFRDMSKMYFELHSLVNKRTAKTTEKYLIQRLNNFFGGKHLSEITPMMIEEYRARRKADVKPATVNREHQCLRHIFTKAIEWGKASNNPAKGIKALRVDNKRLRFLTGEEVQALLSCCDERIIPIVITALNTGMRRGELKNLRWKDIDLERGLIYVLQTKNGKSREVPMNGILRKTLGGIAKTSDQVFDTANLRKLYEQAVIDAKLEDVNFHTLRHTFASHLVMAGIDLTTVKELLGHAKIEMTMRYAHLSSGHKQVAVEILSGRWTQKRTPNDIFESTGVAGLDTKLTEFSVGKA